MNLSHLAASEVMWWDWKLFPAGPPCRACGASGSRTCTVCKRTGVESRAKLVVCGPGLDLLSTNITHMRASGALSRQNTRGASVIVPGSWASSDVLAPRVIPAIYVMKMADLESAKREIDGVK